MNFNYYISEERLIYHKALDAMRLDMRMTFSERRLTRSISEVNRIEENTQVELQSMLK
jgi:hypothetical protein